MSFDDLPLFAHRPTPPGPTAAEVVAETQRSLAEGYVANLIDSHERSLSRVSDRISAAIVAFCTPGREFHADELRAHVTAACGAVAPGSADRILRLLRQQGRVPYRVIDRSKSLYRVTEEG